MRRMSRASVIVDGELRQCGDEDTVLLVTRHGLGQPVVETVNPFHHQHLVIFEAHLTPRILGLAGAGDEVETWRENLPARRP